jgi:hypothetical protein
MLRRKQFPGSRQTCLNFIRHKEHVVLLADLRNTLQISCRRDDDSAFALDRLEHHGGSMWRMVFNRIHVTISHNHKAR